jgi:hypothetical protein
MGIIKFILKMFCCCCQCDDDYSVSSSSAPFAYANESFKAGSNSGPSAHYSSGVEFGHGSYNRNLTPMAPNDFSFLNWEGMGDPFSKSEYDKMSGASLQRSVAGLQCSNVRMTKSLPDQTSTWSTLDARFMGASFPSRVHPNYGADYADFPCAKESYHDQGMTGSMRNILPNRPQVIIPGARTHIRDVAYGDFGAQGYCLRSLM